MGVRGVEDLLDAMNMTGKAGDNDAFRCRGENMIDGWSEFTLGGGEPGDFSIGRVCQEQVNALIGKLGEMPQVGDSVIERELVHLEITSM